MVFQSMAFATLSVFAIKQQVEITKIAPIQLKQTLMILAVNINMLIQKENSSKSSVVDARKSVLNALMAII